MKETIPYPNSTAPWIKVVRDLVWMANQQNETIKELLLIANLTPVQRRDLQTKCDLVAAKMQLIEEAIP